MFEIYSPNTNCVLIFNQLIFWVIKLWIIHPSYLNISNIDFPFLSFLSNFFFLSSVFNIYIYIYIFFTYTKDRIMNITRINSFHFVIYSFITINSLEGISSFNRHYVLFRTTKSILQKSFLIRNVCLSFQMQIHISSHKTSSLYRFLLNPEFLSFVFVHEVMYKLLTTEIINSHSSGIRVKVYNIIPQSTKNHWVILLFYVFSDNKNKMLY